MTKRPSDTNIAVFSYKKPVLIADSSNTLRPDADICKRMVLNAHKKAGQECQDHGGYLKVKVPGTDVYFGFFFDFDLRKEFNSADFNELCDRYGVSDIIWANTWKTIKELDKAYYYKANGDLNQLCCPVFYGAFQASPKNPQVPDRYSPNKMIDKEFELAILD